MKPLALAAALAVLSVPGAARAHGVDAEVVRSGPDVSVRARYHGGRPLAGARYEVVSPAHPAQAHAAGRTDRHGWVAFEADAPGTWWIRIADASGHGQLVEVDVTAGELEAARAAAAPRPSTPAPSSGPAARDADARLERDSVAPPRALEEDAPGGTPLRAAAGALAILALFAGAFVVQRRRRRGAR